MTKSDQIKILNDKIKSNKAQYDLDRINAEISAYSNGDLDKYEFLTKQDLKYKPDALEQAKFTKIKKILQRLKNIEDNLNSNDDDGDNGNGKVGIFQIIKYIKDKGIKISNDDEAIREIREHIQNVRNEGVRVNNFDEISKEIRDHIQNLKDEGIDVNINNDRVNDLVNKVLKGIGKRDSGSKDSGSEDSGPEDLAPDDLAPEDSSRKKLKINTKKFLLIYKEPIITYYTSDVFNKYNINTKKINNGIINYIDRKINSEEFLKIYNAFISEFDNFSNALNKKKPGSRGPNQKELLNHGNELKEIVGKSFNPVGSRLKILTPQQMLTRLQDCTSTSRK